MLMLIYYKNYHFLILLVFLSKGSSRTPGGEALFTSRFVLVNVHHWLDSDSVAVGTGQNETLAVQEVLCMKLE